MKKLTLFVISKDKDCKQNIKDYFSQRGYDILEYNKNRDILDTFYRYNTEIDTIIIAEKNPGYNLSNVIQNIKNYSDVPIFMLSENMEKEVQMLYYRMGLDDYLPYDYSLDLLEIKLELMNKRVHGKSEIIHEGILEINAFRKKIKVDGEDVAITVKEFELLYFLICHKNVIQTRDQILTAVWGINYMGNDRVVDSLIKKLRNKMGEANNYIKTVYGLGYYFEAPEL